MFLIDTAPLGIALILDQGHHEIIVLPVSYDTLHDLHKSLQSMTDARDGDTKLGFGEESVSDDAHRDIVDDPLSLQDIANSRSLRKMGRKPSVEDLLEVLWNQAVEPVLATIWGHHDGQLESGVPETPVSSCLIQVF